MILETALLNVHEGEKAAFEAAMDKAQHIIAAMPGFCGMEVRPSLTKQNQYLLHVHWHQLTDHTEGFRKSEQYKEWKALLHHFYEPMPIVEYFSEPIISR